MSTPLPTPAATDGSPQQYLTLSIGLAVAEPANEEHPGSLIARSDQALYQAKHSGRNCGRAASPRLRKTEATDSA